MRPWQGIYSLEANAQALLNLILGWHTPEQRVTREARQVGGATLDAWRLKASALRPRWQFLCLAFPLLFGAISGTACHRSPPDPDADLDGFPASEDCVDTNPSIHPFAPEVCADGIDQNCDGIDPVCEVPPDDQDHDGYGDIEDGGNDCDDTNPDIHPGAPETPYDGVDQDCSGGDLIDVDGDRFSSVDVGGSDCDDHNSSVYPGGTELPYDGVDQNCDGVDLVDVDGDTFEAQEVDGPDCDDSSASVYPGAETVPYDGIDQDCVGGDERDLDGDGYDAAEAGGPDCDDTSDTVYPGAEEILLNAIDENCDGADGVDADGDGVGTPWDCDDSDAGVHPGALEVACNSIDEDCSAGPLDVDCDGQSVDDCDDMNPIVYSGADELTCNEVDEDCDGSALDVDCDGELALEDGGEDCDDHLDFVHPDALELKKTEQDDNCNGLVNEDIPLTDASSVHTGMAGGRAGTVVAVGDVNGDTLDDVVVGAPEWPNGNGQATGVVFVLYGGSGEAEALLTSTRSTIYGSKPGDLFGSSIAICDMDTDGVDDLVIGAPGHSHAGVSGGGAVYILSGAALTSSVWIDEEQMAYLPGHEEGQAMGAAVACAGDVDADGTDDLLVGAPETSVKGMTQAGSAYLLTGGVFAGELSISSASFKWEGVEPGALTGSFVAGVGDINADGIPDLAISSPGAAENSGRVWIELGRRTAGEWALLRRISVEVGAEGAAAELGPVVAGGDLNGDGGADLLLGAPNMSQGRGMVFFLFSSLVSNAESSLELNQGGSSMLGDVEGDALGASLIATSMVRTAEDTELDTWDAVVGAPGANGGKGAVYLFAGRGGPSWGWAKTATSGATAIWVGDDEEQALGTTVSAGQLDGKGTPDVVFGVPGDDRGGVDSGAVYTFLY